MPHLSPLPWIIIPFIFWLYLILFIIFLWFFPNILFLNNMKNQSKTMNSNLWNWT